MLFNIQCLVSTWQILAPIPMDLSYKDYQEIEASTIKIFYDYVYGVWISIDS